MCGNAHRFSLPPLSKSGIVGFSQQYSATFTIRNPSEIWDRTTFEIRNCNPKFAFRMHWLSIEHVHYDDLVASSSMIRVFCYLV